MDMAVNRAIYHVGNLAESLLDIGDELLRSRPHSSFRLREIAALVPDKPGGVSHTAVFGHYDSMPDYLTAMAGRWWSRLEADLASGPDDSPVELGVRFVSFALDHPQAFRLMYDPGLWGAPAPGSVLAGRHEAMRTARDACVMQFALATGVIPWAAALPPDAVWRRARLFASLAHGLAMEFLDERLFGQAGDGIERRKAQLKDAEELLELAVTGAAVASRRS
jgi:Tetracyclin repressor-like, C-terminal domain